MTAALFGVPGYHLWKLFLRTGDTEKKNWQPTNRNCCVCQPNIVDQIFLSFDRSFLFCFWIQYIQTISKHNPNLPCLRFPSCGILIDAFDLRQTFLLYARLDYDVIKELRHNDTRIKEKCFTLDTQKPKSIMRGEIQIMITDKVSCLDVKAL